MAPTKPYDEDSGSEESSDVAPVKQKATKKRKDANKPKRAMSAFFLYSQANRARIKEENPEAGFGDIARLLAAAYKEVDDDERAKWEAKAAEDKVRYQEEMEGYVPTDDAPKKKAKKDKSGPKRGMSAYMFFANDMRETVKTENPGISFGDIGKKLGAMYRELTDGEKAKYVKLAAKDKERYEKEKAAA